MVDTPSSLPHPPVADARTMTVGGARKRAILLGQAAVGGVVFLAESEGELGSERGLWGSCCCFCCSACWGWPRRSMEVGGGGKLGGPDGIDM